MPTIYTSTFGNFIRQGFAKSFTHGYAQSVIAATHPPQLLHAQNRPTFARRNSTRFSRLQSFQLQSAFHTERTTTAALPDHRQEKATSYGGLDAYFEALQNEQETGEVDKEWSQFQFPKRIEWKPSPASILVGDAKLQDVGGEVLDTDGVAHPSIPTEAEAALAHIDAALEKELQTRQLQEVAEESSLSVRSATPANVPGQSRARTPAAHSSYTPSGVQQTVTPPVDHLSITYANHLRKLSEAGRYAEIPAVFEAMLVGGVQPIASAYNALLMAAIHLPTEKIEIVSKALDIYADMLRRKILPDSDTYNILVGLLAARSLEVSALKKALEDKRTRFGGMDEPGKFMFASHELEHAIVSEDDRLDFAVKMFETSIASQRAAYSAETYHQIISACAQAGRVSDMLRMFEHMESNRIAPFSAVFPAMITAFANSGDLVSAVECYNEYRELAIANDKGHATLCDRMDDHVYAAVINAYVISDKLDGAMKFYEKIVQEYGVRTADINDAIIASGFVKGFIDRGIYHEALRWAQAVENDARAVAMGNLATVAADSSDKVTAVAAFANIPATYYDIATPATALLALSVREGDIMSAARYWNILSNSDIKETPSLIEATAMYAVALIGSGQASDGLSQSEAMFLRIRENASEGLTSVADEIEEGVEFISRFMSARGITDTREVVSNLSSFPQQSFTASPYASTPTVSSVEDTFDPYAHNTDFKGSSLISDDLEGAYGRKGPKLNDALARFRNMRRSGRHPRYITYAKMISAAARDRKIDLCHDILAMARTDVPLLPQYAVVRYGWSSILDAMVGACLNFGNRTLAEQYHQELLDMGATPSANTFGLYITTLKESTKTFDEASEAVKIFHRAKTEGVEPSSFLYNALIGKLGKARRIDDCLFYFAEMRASGIKPTSVTYGTIVNALCRVSDEKFAEELFDEMEAMPNYKARPAPYNSMMQFFLATKHDKAKVLAYYERMKAKGIAPTAHTYKLLIDTHATLEPIDMDAAENVLEMIRAGGQQPEPVHYASLIHARGCVLHDTEGARKVFDSVLYNTTLPVNASIFQALFEAMVANHKVSDTEPILAEMHRRRVELTPYIANTLIHGWAAEKNIVKARAIYNAVSRERREPSTYEAMTRAFLAVEERDNAKAVVGEMVGRGYPSAVVNKVLELLGGGGGEDPVVAHVAYPLRE
jgi:pentatricopeptide repeat protein